MSGPAAHNRSSRYLFTWTAAGPEFGAANPLVALPRAVIGGAVFDVTPDGQRFVIIVEGERDESPITVRLSGSN